MSLIVATQAFAQAPAEYRVPRTTTPPEIDGVLDDAAWRTIAPMPTGQWVSYNPNRGDKMPDAFRTEVRITYDDRNIYVAFHCYDNEPDKIRSTVARRDAAFGDDWIALSLDSAATGQAAYHLFTNPSASQIDALNTPASGEQSDADMVWFSGAVRITDGYTVEVQIPLQTLRFAAAAEVAMNLVFFRKVSRIGYSYAWPEMLPGQWVFDRPSRVVFANLKPRRLVELLPSVTYGINQERDAFESWADTVDDSNVGVSGKLGITPGITLDWTVNPDFSQVESDTFQVQVNQRFPLFFSEKRPFFMEGMGLFNIAGTGGDSNMRTAVHTRRIVDPIYGSKLTGTLGKASFGILNAVDDSPTLPVTVDGEALNAPNQMTTIGRVAYGLGRSDYVGGIFTHTTQNGRDNVVVGADVSWRPAGAHQLFATVLASRTTGSPDSGSGKMAQATYRYTTRRWSSASLVEHYDRDFAMDTAFYNRTGFTGASSFGAVNFYPKSSWLQRIQPFYFAKFSRDRANGGDEHFLHAGIRLNVTRQGFINFSHGRGKESWRGRKYRVGSDFNFFGNMQVLRWLSLGSNFRTGPSIFYSDTDPYQGRSRDFGVRVTVQPNQHLSQSVEYNTVRFTRPSTGALIYDVAIVNSRTTFQFDKHFLVRLLAQYDSSGDRVIADFLASYEFVPGTVFHAGYGSLFQKGSVSPQLIPSASTSRERGNFVAVDRGLFLKASYLRRF